MNIFRLNLFDLRDGEHFEHRGIKYTLVRIEEGDGNAIVIEDNVTGEQNFNPYATITKLGE